MSTRDRLTVAAWFGGVAGAWAKTQEQYKAWRTTHELIDDLTELADRVGRDYIDPYYA